MKDQANSKLVFWTVLVALMLGVSALILLIDVSIKSSILAESARLREAIRHARWEETTYTGDDSFDSRVDSGLYFHSTGVEDRSAGNMDTAMGETYLHTQNGNHLPDGSPANYRDFPEGN